MIRLLVAIGLLTWLGAGLLLSASRRITRPSLTERLAPFAPVEVPNGRRSPVASTQGMLAPAAAAIGDRVAAAMGVQERVEIRLRRVHSPVDPSGFRMRQLAWSAAAFCLGLVAAAAGAPLALSMVLIVGGPCLAFLVVEQRLATASRQWQERLAREAPVVAEQLAMLLNAGFSLTAALTRLADRGRGAAAADLRIVVNRLRQGVAESVALREWAEVAQVDVLTRLVAVLALEREAHDLGRLVSVEARQARRELHRRTVELIERRAQQVWVPVSVATLVPGVILLAVPFLAALRLFANA